ncbi:hypothetical protein HD806DRAFT_522230 [Xylariaceae sp. AK1471]|nr:hypothetical protein HD806DRAFT_522230 [Xylariaceae sp. AK1471]
MPVFEAQQTPVNPPVPRQDPVSPAWSAPSRGPTPRAVTACIEIPMSFSTDWYWHLEAPEFFICSRCYVDHIYAKKFQDEFQSARFTDGKSRVCRFGKPRMKDYIHVEALKSGSLRLAIEWMRLRSTTTDCKGLDGVKGKFSMGIQWYKARENDIPGFISCQACYEDLVMTNQFAQNFELSSQPQPIDAVWVCDMAIPFIENEYEKKGKLNDWQSFASEAQNRITAERCPGGTRIVTYGKNWFVPKARTRGLILCATCYCDHVIHSGEEDKWEIAPELSRSGDHKARCAQGMFNIRILFAEARTKKDYALLWNAVDKLNREKTCEAEGITDGVWYTFPSNPSEFGVCAACYAGILEPLGVSRFWVGKHDVSPGAKMICCFNLSHPRFNGFLPRLFEMFLALDPTALNEYASVYAAIPLCVRDKDTTNRRWYGWNECTICSECYLDFARHSSLAELMEIHDMPLAGSTLCDMYSPRMRALYTECASVNPPDLKRLLEYSVQRQAVYNETMPTVRMILNQQLMALKQQQILNATSAYYSMAGLRQETMFGHTHRYSALGIGSGFANMQLLQAAAYGKQAMEVGAGVGGPMMIVHQLEQRWRAVE